MRIDAIDHDEIIGATRTWLEKAVVGLGLCPFADGVYRAGRVRFHVSEQRSAAGLLDDLKLELEHLARVDATQSETTLLIHPWVLNDFIEYNDFLSVCDATVAALELEGELQIASFHPHYQFADTQADDIENYTNRAPYPTLHILREASVEQALQGIVHPEEIYENNIRTLRRIGIEGWRGLWTRT